MEQLAKFLRETPDDEPEEGSKKSNAIVYAPKRVRFSDQVSPKSPDYANIFPRLDTFEKGSWPAGDIQSPFRLAEAGFYYTGKFINCSLLERTVAINIFPMCCATKSYTFHSYNYRSR